VFTASVPRRHETLAPAGAIALARRAAFAIAVLGLAQPLLAQPAGAVGKGFAFRRPVLSITVRGGYDRPNAASDIFDFTTTNLTLGRSDFAAAGVHLDVAVRVNERTDVVFSGGIAQRRVASEFRNFIDNNDQPIEQTTLLRRAPIAVGVKYALTPPGERIGKFAWIPAKLTPWIGVGGGTMEYGFKQVGDFVDFQTLDVFRDELSSTGFAPMAYGLLGADLSLTTRVSLTGDLRYTYARAKMSESFEGFNRIDLSGAAATVGFTIRI
jgi:hypothetical protein